MRNPVARMITVASLVAATMLALIPGSLALGSSATQCSPTGSEAGPSPMETPWAACPSPDPSREPTASPSPVASLAASPVSGVSVEVEALDPYFAPKEIRLPASGVSRLVLTNRGYVGHNLTVDELGIQLVASRGGSDEIVLVDPPAGTYVFYCSVSGHRDAGMEGTLIVE